MKSSPVPRLDTDSEYRTRALPLCRLKPGEVWEDPERGHQVALADSTIPTAISDLCAGHRPALVINDPPYNITIGGDDNAALSTGSISNYIDWCRSWVRTNLEVLADDAFFYVWLGADQTQDFQPLPEFMILMREFPQLKAKSYITMRNQRGYGTQKNWMFVRQELLCYAKGAPEFTVTYTDIPKILRGYYKDVGGTRTENFERGKSGNIRPGNVWVDIQQVFYRMEENVPGAYAQKPLKAIHRIIETSSREGDVVADFFSHSGTTLIAAETAGRRCLTCDVDPLFAELTIRRLEHFRQTGKTGWQTGNPFPEIELPGVELDSDPQLGLFDNSP